MFTLKIGIAFIYNNSTNQSMLMNPIPSISTVEPSDEPIVPYINIITFSIETSYTYAQFQRSGTITAPATSIPRFKKYSVDDFHFLTVLGKGSFGKVIKTNNSTIFSTIHYIRRLYVFSDQLFSWPIQRLRKFGHLAKAGGHQKQNKSKHLIKYYLIILSPIFILISISRFCWQN